MMKIGAQMYTVREFTKDLDSFAQTLQKIADIGYTTVQVSGTCAFEGGWLAEQLRKTGLECVLTHTPAQRLTDEIDQVIADHNAFGCNLVGLGYQPFNEENPYEKFAALYLPVAEKLKAGGKYFMYHNHDQEFQKIGGKTILEKLAEDIPADSMGFTLDTFWVQAGGGDSALWLEKLSGRIPAIHLKDFAYGRKMAVVGEGNINFDRVFEKAEAGGTKYMLVEQDDCNGEDPFECLRRSYLYLKACGFN